MYKLTLASETTISLFRSAYGKETTSMSLHSQNRNK